MRSTLVSDAHLTGLDDPNQVALVDFLRAWPTDELVLVGDVFDTWWPWPNAVFSAYVPTVAALWELRRRGVALTWVGGNHDFRAGDVLERDLGVSVVDAWRREVGGRRVVAIHGDGADRSARQHVTNAILRGPVARGAMRMLGPGGGWSIARSLSSRSREGGGPGLDRLLDLQRDEADRWLADRADVVCVGHSHAPGVEDRPRGRMVNLGDWLLHRTFALVDDDVHLLHWTDGRAVPVEGGMRRRG